MERALDLARRGLYTTDPNPRVGCVIAHGERVVGEGWHRYAGEPHAEVHALAAAGADAAGATAYVTLEPCRHTGRTGPCTQALIDARIARVVAAMRDPDPRVTGAGLTELAAAGIEVETGLLEARARTLNRGFVSRHERGRPWVRCKLAATLDGRTATAAGESQWLTGEAARADVHRLRAEAGAVLTGIGTILADDPRLDARVEESDPVTPPIRVIADSHLRTPPSARVFTAPGSVLIVSAKVDAAAARALAEAGAEIVALPAVRGRVSLGAAMTLLAERGVNEVHTECGPTLAGALIEADLVDEVVLYLAPDFLGDAARGMFTLPSVAAMRDRIGLDIVDVTRVEADLRITAVPRADTAGLQPRADTGRKPRADRVD